MIYMYFDYKLLEKGSKLYMSYDTPGEPPYSVSDCDPENLLG